MAHEGVTETWEIGAGKALTGMVRRIDVSRGASGGWRYGMQGANGVIVITTRNAPAEHPQDTPPEACGFVFPR